jgi:hypothetical protein
MKLETTWTRLCSYVVSVGSLFAFAGGVLPAKESGLMGAHLATTRNTNDFFLFFNFEPIGTEKLPGTTQLTTFKPSGDAFKALVTLCVTTNFRGTIQKLQLFIARSFIDDPKQCVYAADLAKSFLRQASFPLSQDAIDSLAIEIEARTMAGSTATILTSRPSPSLSSIPSAAYQTYAGGPHPQTLAYPHGKQLTLRNLVHANERVLEMTVSPTA